VTRNIDANPKGRIFNRMRRYIAHADDVLVLGQLMRVTEKLVTQINAAAISTESAVKESKTKYTKINRNKTYLEHDLLIDGQLFEEFRILDI
jgi:hypothetical protein